MNDYVANYLVKNNFMLTALEFYQELLEEGQELKLLRDYFENKEYKNEQASSSSNSSTGNGMMIQVDSQHTKALEEQLKKKDETISMMEYEIRLLQSDIAKLKGQTKENFVVPTVNKTKTNSNGGENSEGNDDENAEGNEESTTTPNVDNKMASEPLSVHEKQVINYLVKDYLVKHGYKISAISFTDEVHEMDMFNLDEILSNSDENELPIGLSYLYRHYYSGGDKTKQNMKDTKALREALAQLEQKDKLIQSLEKSIQRQDKTIEKLKVQVESNSASLADDTPLNSSNNSTTNDESNSVVVSQDVMVLQAKLREYENQESSIIQILGEKLPSLLETAKSNKRQEFMPILVATLQSHPDAEVRETLSESLFNLIKKPDDQQRQMIINGCISLARRISPDRFEKELLPQCWKQITHKYTERKILVAEACGELSHYVKASLRPTMLLTTLFKLMEDKTDEVRASVVINLAKLVKTFTEEQDVESKSKYFQIEEMTLKFLYDKSEAVEEAATMQLVPSLITWCFTFDYLFEKFAPTLLSNIENLIKKRLKSGSNASSAKIVVLLRCFSGVIPYIVKLMTKTMPSEIYNSDNKDEHAMKKMMDKYIGETSLSDLEKTKSASWKGLYWLLNVCTRRLLSIAASVNIEHSNISREVYSIFNGLCEVFGEPVISKIFEQKIVSLLETSSDTIIDGTIEVVKKEKDTERTSVTIVKERLLPVYICGILPFSPKERISEVLRTLIINVSISERTWEGSHMPFLYNALISGVTMNEKLRNDILTVVCKLAVNPSKVVRSSVADILTELIEPLESEILAAQILPAFITVASDMETDIKMKAVRGLGILACSLSEERDFNKLSNQFDHLLDSRDRNMFKEVLIVFSQIIPQVDAYFRDNFMIKKLVWLGKQNNQNSDLRDRRDTANLLLDNYRALNGCILTDELISDIIEGLKLLSNDCELITDSSVASFVSQMKEELEAIVQQHAKEQTKGSTLISFSALIDKMKPNMEGGGPMSSLASSTASILGSKDNSSTNNASSSTTASSSNNNNSNNSASSNNNNSTNWQGIGSGSSSGGGGKTNEEVKENLKKIFTFGLVGGAKKQ